MDGHACSRLLTGKFLPSTPFYSRTRTPGSTFRMGVFPRRRRRGSIEATRTGSSSGAGRGWSPRGSWAPISHFRHSAKSAGDRSTAVREACPSGTQTHECCRGYGSRRRAEGAQRLLQLLLLSAVLCPITAAQGLLRAGVDLERALAERPHAARQIDRRWRGRRLAGRGRGRPAAEDLDECLLERRLHGDLVAIDDGHAPELRQRSLLGR